MSCMSVFMAEGIDNYLLPVLKDFKSQLLLHIYCTHYLKLYFSIALHDRFYPFRIHHMYVCKHICIYLYIYVYVCM